MNDTATPISIQFEWLPNTLVLPYSAITVANNVMFKTENLLVMVDPRDEWNNTIDAPVEVFDQDGNVVGVTTGELKYNATLGRGQFVSKKTLYLGRFDRRFPHVTFHGTWSLSFVVI